ncbi:MAG: hypothetical protein HOW97_02190 [Catenulispora sp.]|nr:hypothetical protein [Catenulispora sp.]
MSVSAYPAGPASRRQRTMWEASVRDPRQPVFQVVFGKELRGPVEPERLERAIAGIVARHEVLRTALVPVDGVLHQFVAPSGGFRLGMHTVDPAVADRDAEVRRLAVESAREPFDLSEPGLLRADLYRISAERHILVVVVHHSVFDGVSREIFDDELRAHYEGEPLEPLPIQYCDVVRYQAEARGGPQARASLDFWSRTLAAPPPRIELPGRRTGSGSKSGSRAGSAIEDFVERRIEGDALAELTATAGRLRSTPLHLFLASFAVLVAGRTGQTDMVIAANTSCRNTAAESRLIGLFTGLVLLRIGIRPGDCFADLVHRVRDATLDAFEHQDAGLDDIEAALVGAGAEEGSLRSRVSVGVSTYRFGRSEIRFAGIEMTPFDIDLAAPARLELAVNVGSRPGRIVVTMPFSTAAYPGSVVRRHWEDWTALLEAGVRNPQAGVDELAAALPVWDS